MYNIFLPTVNFRYLPKVLQELSKYYADNETFCTDLPTSQAVMIQSLQPKGREFESVFLTFIRFV